MHFAKFTDRVTIALGSKYALLASVLVVVVWAFFGPVLDYSDSWQLFINTSTTVVTFWMVFVIQASQNRSDKATHLKLDTILKWMEAHEAEEAIGAEKLTDDEIDQIATRLGVKPR